MATIIAVCSEQADHIHVGVSNDPNNCVDCSFTGSVSQLLAAQIASINPNEHISFRHLYLPQTDLPPFRESPVDTTNDGQNSESSSVPGTPRIRPKSGPVVAKDESAMDLDKKEPDFNSLVESAVLYMIHLHEMKSALSILSTKLIFIVHDLRTLQIAQEKLIEQVVSLKMQFERLEIFFLETGWFGCDLQSLIQFDHHMHPESLLKMHGFSVYRVFQSKFVDECIANPSFRFNSYYLTSQVSQLLQVANCKPFESSTA
jgi:hypothetical protein